MAGRPPGRPEMILEKNETFTVTEAMDPATDERYDR